MGKVKGGTTTFGLVADGGVDPLGGLALAILGDLRS